MATTETTRPEAGAAHRLPDPGTDPSREVLNQAPPLQPVNLFEVDLALRGLEVRLRFDPWTLARVQVDYRGQSFGLARKVDRHLNSQLQGVLTYEK